ncbi:hypothetical protein BDA99DRAFT_539918 [Phascolomyces articulosus]|uniref:DASH complex subunit DAD2 n=1 Tax=Phascolomyces articulosus TaxID=60185 RepID=A0AAD5JV90_9FUNG|nr:hypothetical protein BDA99DRAFT_539918 [Phascolomyces articulosus]
MQRGSTRSQRSQNNTSGHATKQQQKQQPDHRSPLIREKEQEFRELSNIKKQSEQLVHFFEELQKSMHGLSQGVQGTADTLENWNHVFRIMASMKDENDNDKNDSHGDKSNNQNPMFVRLPINDSKTTTTATTPTTNTLTTTTTTSNPTSTFNIRH